MIEHLVFFALKPELGELGKQKFIEQYRSLLGIIPGLVDVQIGENISTEKEFRHGYGLGMRMLFASREHSVAYLEHPAHKAVASFVFASITGAAVCDFKREI